MQSPEGLEDSPFTIKTLHNFTHTFTITVIFLQFCSYFNFSSLFQPPICDANGENVLKKRRKRQTLELDENRGLLYDTDREDLKVKVYRGLYVSEASDFDDAFIDDETPTEVVSF